MTALALTAGTTAHDGHVLDLKTGRRSLDLELECEVGSWRWRCAENAGGGNRICRWWRGRGGDEVDGEDSEGWAYIEPVEGGEERKDKDAEFEARC